MKPLKRQKGQTVIETALVMILILLLFFGIAEFARAWWLKGQLNNAARVAARKAVVMSPLTSGGSCSAATDEVVISACNAITSADLKNSANVIVGSNGNLATPATGDEITVTVTGNFTSVVPKLLSGMIGPVLPARATMRHE